MPSKNEKTGVAEEQAQNPEESTKTRIVFGDPANAAIVAADEINRLHQELRDAFRTGINKAIRIGELLTEQHERCKHGEWLPWLKANVRFCVKTAYNYESIYRDRSKFVNVTNLTEAYRILEGKPERGQKSGDRIDPALRPPPSPVRPFLKVHFRNALDRDQLARRIGQELYDHTREIDFRKVEDVVIDVAPVLDHNKELLADAHAQWHQFCESHPFHPPEKLAQTQMAMLLVMFRLGEDIALSLPPPTEATDDVAAARERQEIGVEELPEGSAPPRKKSAGSA